MPGIKKGTTLGCDQLKILFYNNCQNPPVLQDPLEVYYAISKVKSTLCGEEIIRETIDSTPLRSGIGKYYVPVLPSNLEVGKYKVRWKFRQSDECTFSEICDEFVLYSERECTTIDSVPSNCICFS
jgi:hypothetical protein